MIIKNIKVYTEDKTFADGKIIIREGVFEEIIIGQTTASDLELQDTEIVDGKGCYAIPGLIDMHFHGCMGDDFCDGTKDITVFKGRNVCPKCLKELKAL